jgi:hypothetical protein
LCFRSNLNWTWSYRSLNLKKALPCFHQGLDLPEPDDPVAQGVEISGNFIGVDRFRRLIEDAPDQLVGIANFGGARETEIQSNTIGGHSQFGLWIESGTGLTVDDNHIGVSTGGQPLPNGGGVRVQQGTVVFNRNTVANNTNGGYFIEDDDNAVSIFGGSVYRNGAGAGPLGILHSAPPVDPVTDLRVFRSNINPGNRMVDVTIALPAVGGIADEGGLEPETTLEIWSNRFEGETQGRTLVLSKVIDPEKPFAHKLTVKPDSPFAGANNFTATLTREPFTSMYSEAVKPDLLDWPQLDYSPVKNGDGVTIKEDEIGFEWPADTNPPLFTLEQAASFAGPWIPVSDATTVSNGTAQVTVRMEGDEQYFRLVFNTESLQNLNFADPAIELLLEPPLTH